MTGVAFRVMFLGLLRDRGALLMTFVVPAVFFVVFASVFAASSGREFRPRVAVTVDSDVADAAALLEELAAGNAVRIATWAVNREREVRDRVRRGEVDVGLLVTAAAGSAVPDFVIVTDPARDVAAQILRANVERAYATRYLMPGGMRDTFGPTVTVQTVAGEAAGANEVAYSAGAVALLFLLLSAVHGAVSLFDERDGGITERIVAGPAGTRPLVDGKFLYLALLGVLQVSVIFTVGWFVYGVDLPANFPAWMLTTVFAAAAAGGLALGLTSVFRTRHQALTVANVTVLILSALGGSMIPRFLMPSFLQQLGWVTPNAWALEAYTAIFWRGEPLNALAVPMALLALTAVAGLMVARAGAKRFESI